MAIELNLQLYGMMASVIECIIYDCSLEDLRSPRTDAISGKSTVKCGLQKDQFSRLVGEYDA